MEKTRENAEVKILHHDCGCKKGICLVKGKPETPCTISCSKCHEYRYIDPCATHQQGKGGIGSVIKIAYA